MTRGFITIATGKEFYYQLAHSLLMSYRLYSAAPLPFYILCDRENAYTKDFDQAILFQPGAKPFWDKFELLIRSPFDETIFIDADCLAYADLNDLWDYFADADDFTGCGINYPIESEKGLFQDGAIGEYNGRVHWKPDICGGLYFIRRGDACNALYKECQHITQHYDDFVWPDYCAPYADETVLCLAMAVHGMHAKDADPRNYGIPWEATEMDYDIFTGKCTYATQWHAKVSQGYMIHFSTAYCRKPGYIFEVEKLNLMLKKKLQPSKTGFPLNPLETLLYRWKLRFYWLQLKDFSKRAVRKLWRIITRTPPTD